MFRYAGIGLFGLFLLMVIPAGFENMSQESQFYGAAHLVVHDGNGDEVFEQTIHNTLVNQGEEFLLAQVFQTGSNTADTASIASICGTSTVVGFSESTTDGDFDSANAIADGGTASTPCREDETAALAVDGTADISVTLTAGVNVDTGETITGIGICQGRTGQTGDFASCDAGGGGGGVLFAFVDTSDVQLDATTSPPEDVTVTYTFDISSPND